MKKPDNLGKTTGITSNLPDLPSRNKKIPRGVLAEAIRTVVGLYRDGYLKKSANCASPFPDVPTFHEFLR